MTEEIELRVYGAEGLPVLVYLPGLHGDWTLVGSFRQALRGRVRFVEMTYPRTVSWSLDDYAAAVELALANQDIRAGWLLGESFGSQLVWPLLARDRFHTEGVILAGGFVRHPVRVGVLAAERLTGGLSLRLITWVLFGYARVARWRYRRSPEVMKDIAEFIARRTEQDRRAAQHRLQLIARNDPCTVARETKVPLFAMTGLWDPVVPWVAVRPWLRRHCAALREYRIVRQADHNVLGTAPDIAAEQVIQWISRSRRDPRPSDASL